MRCCMSQLLEYDEQKVHVLTALMNFIQYYVGVIGQCFRCNQLLQKNTSRTVRYAGVSVGHHLQSNLWRRVNIPS